jgi:hypothetical protein
MIIEAGREQFAARDRLFLGEFKKILKIFKFF